MQLKLGLISLGLFILVLGAAGTFVIWKLNQPIAASGKIEFLISSGESGQEIGENLQEAGVMNSYLFVSYVRFKNLTSKIQAGRYDIPLTLTPIQIIELLQHGTFDVRLTFLEGWRKEQYLSYALEMLAVDDEEFTLEYNSLTKNLEGFLFPDTYIVPVNITAADLVAIFRDNFDVKYAQISTAAQSSGLTKKQIVTIASLVERETSDDTDSQDEMRTIAGIIVKRLKVPMLLQIDATLQYILGYQKDTGKWWVASSSAIAAATSSDSPYNTYKYLGLPPGPIANPGLDSLLATVNYKRNTRYLYYLHDADGQIHYAEDYEEHKRNIVKYLR